MKERNHSNVRLVIINVQKKGILTKHIAAVHEGKKPFKCEACDAKFTSKQGMNGHIATVHEGKKPFKCKPCDYECAQKGQLRKHIVTVHEGKKPFAQIEVKVEHVSKSNDENQSFECYICDSKFTIEPGMVNGYMATKVEGDQTYYTCKDCNVILASHEKNM